MNYKHVIHEYNNSEGRLRQKGKNTILIEYYLSFLFLKMHTKIMKKNKNVKSIKYIRLRPMSWYVSITGLFPFGKPLIVTWTTPWVVSMSCSCNKKTQDLSKGQSSQVLGKVVNQLLAYRRDATLYILFLLSKFPKNKEEENPILLSWLSCLNYCLGYLHLILGWRWQSCLLGFQSSILLILPVRWQIMGRPSDWHPCHPCERSTWLWSSPALARHLSYPGTLPFK